MHLRKFRYQLTIGGILWVFLGHLPLLSADEAQGEYSSWKWKLGAEERLRWEYRHDFDFNENLKDNGSLFFHRLKLNATAKLTDENLNEKALFFIEGLDAQTGGYQLKPQASQTDDFDFHQGYVQLFDVLDSNIDFKGGRMEAQYGSGRLIAKPAWSNRMRHFDGGILGYHNNGLHADALYLQDVKYDDNNFNKSLNGEFLTGIYGWYQEEKASPLYEFYFLPQIITAGTSDIERYTVGTRLQGYLPHQVLLEIEFPFQFGENGARDIQAHALNVSLSKEWETAWKPQVSLEYNHATGDEDSTDDEVNTFIPIYQGTHSPYGIMDLFRWQNMREVAVALDVSPVDKWKFTPQVNFFWLENKNDSWYNSSGTVVRSQTSGERDAYIGSELSLRANYEINKNIKWETGYAHFFAGNYVKDSGAHDDTGWVYSQMSFKY